MVHRIAAASIGGAVACSLFYLGANRYRKFVVDHAPLAQGCPEIGQRVHKVVQDGSHSYFVFGATGHSLATCKQLKKHSENKTFTYRDDAAHDNLLHYFNTQSRTHYAYNYAEANASLLADDPELCTPAVAYLGIRGDMGAINAVRNKGFLTVRELNQKNPDIQVVYIDEEPV